MRKVLVVCERYWPEGGGAEYAVHSLIDLIAGDLDLTILTGTSNPVHHRSVRFIHVPALRARNKLVLWEKTALLSRADWLVDIAKKTDVVYIPRLSYPLIPFARALDKHTVVHLHDYQPIRFDSTYRIEDWKDGKLSLAGDFARVLRFERAENASLEKAIAASVASPLNAISLHLVRKADCIICASVRQAEIIARHVPDIRSKIVVIPNPVPPGSLRPRESWQPSFVFVGGFSRAKGFHVLARAAEVLLRTRSARFTIVGVGEEEMKPNALDPALKNSFVMLGRIPHSELMQLFESCTAVVVPCISEEPLPTVVIEAMLSGTVPIASRVGGIPEIVSGTQAEKFLFNPGQTQELVERMEWVLTMPQSELLDMGAVLREEAMKKFDMRDLRRRYLEVLQGRINWRH